MTYDPTLFNDLEEFFLIIFHMAIVIFIAFDVSLTILSLIISQFITWWLKRNAR